MSARTCVPGTVSPYPNHGSAHDHSNVRGERWLSDKIFGAVIGLLQCLAPSTLLVPPTNYGWPTWADLRRQVHKFVTLGGMVVMC